jgi:hypothetical protein
MGQFRIVIEGEGPHHNGGAPTDADKVARDTVVTLQAMGHKVVTADFEHDYDADKAAFTAGEVLVDLDEKPNVAEASADAGAAAQAGAGSGSAEGEGSQA